MIEFGKQEKPLTGDIKVQGDKDISYFSIILSSLASGKSKINGLLESKNVLNLIEIIKELGINIQKENDGSWSVDGKGMDGFKEPINIIDIANSKEILFLLVGLLSSYNFKLFFKGDDCLSNINLKNIFEIFESLGVGFNGRNNENLPFLMTGNNDKKQLNYEIDYYDSLLKDVLLLSSLNVQKENVIVEKEKSKNHLEIMMKYFGISLDEHDVGNRGNLTTKVGKEIILTGKQVFSSKEITVPSSVSFSAFIAALAVLIPDSNIILKNVLINQHRDAFYRSLIDMGADITFINQRIVCGEKVADINVKYSELKDTVIPANRLYKMTYEYPILVLIASLTNAKIEIQGTKAIKYNDSENYKYLLYILKEFGVKFEEESDSLKIEGTVTNYNKKVVVSEGIKDSNVILTVAMFGFFIKESVETAREIENDFPDLVNFLKGIGLNVNNMQ